MTKKLGIYNEKGTLSSMNSVDETGQPHPKEINWTPILHSEKAVAAPPVLLPGKYHE